MKSGYIDENNCVKKKNGKLIELESKYWASKDEEKDTTGIERIIGVYGGSYGSLIVENDESNFVEKYVETNKIYDEKAKWQMNKRPEDLLDNLSKDCKGKNENWAYTM